jgi:hypothetical protein
MASVDSVGHGADPCERGLQQWQAGTVVEYSATSREYKVRFFSGHDTWCKLNSNQVRSPQSMPAGPTLTSPEQHGVSLPQHRWLTKAGGERMDTLKWTSEDIGTRIKVWWARDKVYYPGTITDYNV